MLGRFRCVQIFHKQYNAGEKTTVVILYTYITLIAMQGHQTKSKNKTETMQHIKHGSNNILLHNNNRLERQSYYMVFKRVSRW